MIKHIIFILSLVCMPLLAQEESGLQINMEAPENVVAGTSFEVTINLSKGSLTDYSRFSQDLPAGFTAANISSPNADFTFDEERIRIIWLKLPVDKEIVVKYSIDVHPRLSGVLKLGGTFAYVENGARKFIDISEKKSVTILPSPDIDQSLVVDIGDFKKVFESEAPAIKSDFASVIRESPAAQPNGIVTVTLLVHKPEGTKYLKLEETIPGGYSFEAVQTNKAIVSQAASIAKFVWMKPPEEEYFLLKYRLVPILEQDQQALLIQGTITYTEGEQNMVEEIEELVVALDALSVNQRMELLRTGVVPNEVASVPVAKTTPVKEVKPDVRKPEVKKTSSTEKSKNSSVDSITDLDKESGIYFRVQVAAIRNPYFANVYFSEYDLLKGVRVEKLDGWYKYTVGSVSRYEEAVKLKNKVQQQTPVKSAFVVAYIDGKRVPVKEARAAL